MGSASSKSSPGAGIVFQRSQEPIQISEDLLQHLDSLDSSDSTRSLELESTIQKRVSEELKKLRDAESKALAQISYELSLQNIASESKSELNSVILSADLDDLKKQVQRRLPQGHDSELVKQVSQRKQGVISCLKDNKDRALDCKTEVEQFKASVRSLQQEFISKYH